MKEFLDFKLLSLDVRRIRSATKRRFLFTRLNERRYDIIFLQETYSIVDVEDIWRTQWRAKLFFAHGSNHSCGVMTLARSDLDFNSGQELKLKTCISTGDIYHSLRDEVKFSLRTSDAFPVIASLPPKNSYFSEGEKRRPGIRQLLQR